MPERFELDKQFDQHFNDIAFQMVVEDLQQEFFQQDETGQVQLQLFNE